MDVMGVFCRVSTFGTVTMGVSGYSSNSSWVSKNDKVHFLSHATTTATATAATIAAATATAATTATIAAATATAATTATIAAAVAGITLTSACSSCGDVHTLDA